MGQFVVHGWLRSLLDTQATHPDGLPTVIFDTLTLLKDEVGALGAIWRIELPTEADAADLAIDVALTERLTSHGHVVADAEGKLLIVFASENSQRAQHWQENRPTFVEVAYEEPTHDSEAQTFPRVQRCNHAHTMEKFSILLPQP